MIYALDGNTRWTKEKSLNENITSATYYRQIEKHIKKSLSENQIKRKDLQRDIP